MATTYNEDGSKRVRKGNKKPVKLAESFIGVSGETGPMSKKEFKKFKQFIKDSTPAGIYLPISREKYSGRIFWIY